MEMLRLLLGAFFHKLVDKPAVRAVRLEDLPVAKDLLKKYKGDGYRRDDRAPSRSFRQLG